MIVVRGINFVTFTCLPEDNKGSKHLLNGTMFSSGSICGQYFDGNYKLLLLSTILNGSCITPCLRCSWKLALKL